jgi:hypothetical protein
MVNVGGYMSILLNPFKKVINATISEVIDSQITADLSKVLTTFVDSLFGVVDETLIKVQDITEEVEEEPPDEP